jgi:hypothetical protein
MTAAAIGTKRNFSALVDDGAGPNGWNVSRTPPPGFNTPSQRQRIGADGFCEFDTF